MLRNSEIAMQNLSDLENSDVVSAASGTIDSLDSDRQFVLQGPMGACCYSGIQRMLCQSSIDTLTSQGAAVLDAIDEDEKAVPLLVGAMPFDRAAPCWLYQPRTRLLTVQDRMNTWRLSHGSTFAMTAPSVRLEPHREVYQEMVREVITKLRQKNGTDGALRKVVLARSLVVDCRTSFDMGRLLLRLMEDSSVTTYCLPLPVGTTNEAPRYLLGATPELLISRRGAQIESRPLAGSMPRSRQSGLDQDAANHLIRSEKDRAEHRLVVEFIADFLNPLCADLRVPANPSLRATRSMWHLETHMTGTLKHPDDMDTSSSLAIAAQLQPTPALCGCPRQATMNLIRQLEPFERGFYGGAIGWSDAAGNGDWHVAIRCAEIQGHQARLYAGAGIVRDSEPISEADETAAKFNTMIYALELDEVLENTLQTSF